MVVETVPKDILDKLTAGITISATDLDIRDLIHTQDSIKIGDGTDFLAIDASGLIGVNALPNITLASQASPFTDDIKVTLDSESVAVTGTFYPGTQPVSATDLDIRDLASAQDEVKAIIRADTAANQTDDLKITLAGESVAVTGTFYPVTQPVSGTFWQETQPVSGTFWQETQPVSATDLDIRDLTSVSDSVAAVQSGTWTITTTDPWKDLADNGTVISNWGTATDTTSTLYTVPANTVAYITAVMMSMRNSAAGANATAQFYLNNKEALSIKSGVTDEEMQLATLSFPIPVKLTAGQTVQIYSPDAGIALVGTFTGYEIAV